MRILAIVILVSLQAQALIGKSVTTGKFNFACRITEASDPTFVCSGTKTDRGIVTAAHCIMPFAYEELTEDERRENPDYKPPQIVVNCGDGPRLTVTRLLVDPEYTESWNDTSPEVDRGIIEVAEISIEKNLPVLTSPKQMDETLFDLGAIVDDISCIMWGYGEAGEDWNDTSLHVGPVTDTEGLFSKILDIEDMYQQIAQKELKEKKDIDAWFAVEGTSQSDYLRKNSSILRDAGVVDTMMTQGDSGGSLLCRKGETDRWTLVGINHGITFDSTANTKPERWRSTEKNQMMAPNTSKTTETTYSRMFWAKPKLDTITREIWPVNN